MLDKLAVEREETAGKLEPTRTEGNIISADVGTDINADIEEDIYYYLNRITLTAPHQ